MRFVKDKKAKSVIAIYSVALLVYVLAFLVIPFSKNAASWISFIATILAIIFSLYACWVAFNKCESAMSAVYAFPVFRIGLIYAVVQFAAGLIISVLGCFVSVPYWIALILSAALLGATVIGIIITDNARDAVEEVEEKTYEVTKTISQFQIDISTIVRICKDENAKEKLNALNLAFQYSDPVSNSATQAIETQIADELAELKELVCGQAAEYVLEKTAKIQDLLSERNDLCKANKHLAN